MLGDEPDRKKEPENGLPYEVAESLLYLCDCPCDSARVDPDFHAYQCAYRIKYWQRVNARKQDNQSK